MNEDLKAKNPGNKHHGSDKKDEKGIMVISEDGKKIIMRADDNWHFHYRYGPLLDFLVGILMKHGFRRRVVAEPNTVPPKLTGKEALEYRDEILIACLKNIGDMTYAEGIGFEPIPVVQLTEHTTPDIVREAWWMGIEIFKIYPLHVTTHSNIYGVVDYSKLNKCFETIAQLNRDKPAGKRSIVVQFHAEHPSFDIEGTFKEEAFLEQILSETLRLFPTLKVTVEHISSKYGVDWVNQQGPNVAAGVTPQHILRTRDHRDGYNNKSDGLTCVHESYKPQAKDRKDRAAIQNELLVGNPKFFGADDGAWHLKKNKHCARPACGAANTLAALPSEASFFEEHGKLKLFEPFRSEYGARFYGYPLNEETITMVKEQWTIPEEIAVPGLDDSVVPWRFGETMEWKVLAH